MGDTVMVEFYNDMDNSRQEIEIPLDITAQELAMALNRAFLLGMDVENIFGCYLVAENPIAFLKGNKTLREFGIRNGSQIIYKRDSLWNINIK